MKKLFAVLCYVGAIVTFLQGWVLFAVFFIVLFTMQYSAAFFLPLAFLSDGYFGNFYTIPYATLCVLGWYVLSELIRPRLHYFTS